MRRIARECNPASCPGITLAESSGLPPSYTRGHNPGDGTRVRGIAPRVGHSGHAVRRASMERCSRYGKTERANDLGAIRYRTVTITVRVCPIVSWYASLAVLTIISVCETGSLIMRASSRRELPSQPSEQVGMPGHSSYQTGREYQVRAGWGRVLSQPGQVS